MIGKKLNSILLKLQDWSLLDAQKLPFRLNIDERRSGLFHGLRFTVIDIR